MIFLWRRRLRVNHSTYFTPSSILHTLLYYWEWILIERLPYWSSRCKLKTFPHLSKHQFEDNETILFKQERLGSYQSWTEYQIPNYSVFENFTNTKLFDFWKWTNTEYWIVLFGLNYSNTKYLKSNSSPPKKFIFEFCDQMRWGKFDPLFSYLHEGFLLFFLHISCLWKILELFVIRWQLFGYSNIIRK